MTPHLFRYFSNMEALRFGWQMTMENLRPFLIVGAVGAFLTLISQALAGVGGHGFWRALLGFCIQVMQAGIAMVYMRLALKLVDGQEIDLRRPSELLPGFFSFALTAVCYGLVVTFGFMLLLVPGVIWALKYGYAQFLAIDEDLDPLAAMRASARVTEGVKTQLLGFALLLFGLNFLGALAFGIGTLVTIPTSTVAAAFVLRKLEAQAGRATRPTPASEALSGQLAAT